MKVAYDISLMRPACVLVAAALGGDLECANAFDSRHWLLAPTENMKVYPVTSEQLAQLVKMTERKNP